MSGVVQRVKWVRNRHGACHLCGHLFTLILSCSCTIASSLTHSFNRLLAGLFLDPVTRSRSFCLHDSLGHSIAHLFDAFFPPCPACLAPTPLTRSIACFQPSLTQSLSRMLASSRPPPPPSTSRLTSLIHSLAHLLAFSLHHSHS